MLLCYITDRTQFPGDEAARRNRVLEKIAEAARCGIDYIQLREKDLSARELEILARDAMHRVRDSSRGQDRKTGLLINSRADVAIASHADGIHLRSNDILPSQVRQLWNQNPAPTPVIAVSCHSADEVSAAAMEKADFAVFAPVFEKHDSPSASATGLEALRQACRHSLPVLALGGVTLDNAATCMDAGAAGIAAIRLFQENKIAKVMRKLRA